MNKLPQELVDHVIDHLYGDRKALYSCALTCRNWSQSAQGHLFKKFVVSKKSLLFLETTPALWPYVKQLDIQGLSTAVSFSASRLSLFKHLKSLSLTAFFTSDDRENPTRSFFDDFPPLETLEELDIQYFCFSSPEEVIRLTRFLPRLQDLRLFGVQWLDNRSPLDLVSTNFKSSLPLQFLRCYPWTRHTDRFIDKLLELHPRLNLWAFDVGLSSSNFDRILPSCPHSLRLIDLRCASKPFSILNGNF